jgi:hypothetical protein
MVVTPAPGGVGASPVVLLGIVLNAIAALVFGGLHLLLEPPPLRAVVWPGAGALAVAYAVPAALAVVALRGRRPAALLGAGLVGLPLAFTALSGVSLVLVVPAACYLIGYAAWRPRPPLRAGAVAGIAAILATGVAALALLFASPIGEPRGYCYSWTEDPAGRRTYGPARPDAAGDPGRRSGSGSPAPDLRPGGRGCTSDVVTPAEAALGLGAAAVALAVGLRLPRASRARPAAPAPPSRPPE